MANTRIVSDLVLPAGVPQPLVWFTPRHVETDVSGNVTKFLNQGSTGATNDATPDASHYATITQPAGWGGRDVITLASTTQKAYSFGNVPEGRTIISITTYGDGTDTTFSGYAGFVTDGAGSSNQIVGSDGDGYFYFTNKTYFFDGVNVGSSNPVFLPAVKKGVAATDNGSFAAVGTLFYDKGFTGRTWDGLVGDVLVFQDILTDQQIADVHAALNYFYSDASGFDDDVLCPFFAVEMLFDGAQTLRLWTGYGTLVYQGESWFGTGSLLTFDSVEELSLIHI